MRSITYDNAQFITLTLPDKDEDPEVEDTDEDDGCEHSTEGKEVGVGAVRSAIPEAGARFHVIDMVSPAKEVGHLHQEGHKPHNAGHDQGGPLGEDLLILLMVADGYVPVDTEAKGKKQ